MGNLWRINGKKIGHIKKWKNYELKFLKLIGKKCLKLLKK